MTWRRTRAIQDSPPISRALDRIPASFSEGVDAGVVWTNGKAYFFKGSQFVRFELPAERVDPGYPRRSRRSGRACSPRTSTPWRSGRTARRTSSPAINTCDTTSPATRPTRDSPLPLQATGPVCRTTSPRASTKQSYGTTERHTFSRVTDMCDIDIAADRVESGYPQAITGNWPGVWSDGVGR